MATDWFCLYGVRLERAKAPRETQIVHWNECDVENLIALNPNFLGVADHMPVRLGGLRSPDKAPDQIYVDELGRIVVVEIKSIRAGLGDLAQAIAYADHWRLLPPGEIRQDLRRFGGAQGRAREFGRAVFELRAWAEGNPNREPKPADLQRFGKAFLEKIDPEWARQSSTEIGSLAQQRCGDHHPPFTGAPARIVLVAPDFKDECTEFAQLLVERKVGIELVRVRIVRSAGRIYVGREVIVRVPHDSVAEIEPTWLLLRRAWRQPEVRERFDLNGWADHRPWDYSFSLSARKAPDARFWLWASEGEGGVWTAVPDNWHKGDPKRRDQLHKKFLKALPGGPHCSGRYPHWDFNLPREGRALDRRILDVANAIHSVLVHETPTSA